MTQLLREIKGIRGIIHAGAHYGEEGDAYHAMGASNVCWIEPDPESFRRLVNIGCRSAVYVNCALGEVSEYLPLHRASNEGMSSSLLVPKLHCDQYVDITFEPGPLVEVRPLHDLPLNFSCFNLLVVDTQGFERQVLNGASPVLRYFDSIIIEFSRVELYEGCILLPELCEYLTKRGFYQRSLAESTSTWGDALFTR